MNIIQTVIKFCFKIVSEEEALKYVKKKRWPRSEIHT